MITAIEVMKQLATYRIMNAIGSDKDYGYYATKFTFVEVEPYQKYNLVIDMSDYNIKDDIIISIVPEDEKEGKQYHKLVKNPQHIYPALIKRYLDDDKFELDVLFVIEHGSSGKAAIQLSELIIDDFIKYKKFETFRDIEKYVMKFENKMGIGSDLI